MSCDKQNMDFLLTPVHQGASILADLKRGPDPSFLLTPLTNTAPKTPSSLLGRNLPATNTAPKTPFFGYTPRFGPSSSFTPLREQGPTIVTNEDTESESEDEKTERKVLRQVGLFPVFLRDPEWTGYLDIHKGVPSFVTARISEARIKTDRVYRGVQKFGRSVVISSFTAYCPPFKMEATVDMIMFMHLLFSKQVCHTSIGKVSVYPLTVYNNPQDMKKGKQGYPVVAIHKAHMKTLLWCVSSVGRKIFGNNTMTPMLKRYECPYFVDQDQALNIVSGLDPYNSAPEKVQGGYSLLSAEWLDVMKSFFVGPNGESRRLGDIFRTVYSNRPETLGKFLPEHQAVWLGEQRGANVARMLGIDDKGYNSSDKKKVHCFSMARARAYSGQITVGNNGEPWHPHQPNRKTPVTYDELSLGYGVQLSNEQLWFYNTMYTFFSNRIVSFPCHMNGMMQIQPELPVNTRGFCILNGIYDDRGAFGKVSAYIRAARHKLKTDHGAQFTTNYWGTTRTVYRLPKRQKK